MTDYPSLRALCQPLGTVATLGVSSSAATLAEAPLVMHRASLLARHLLSPRGTLQPLGASEAPCPATTLRGSLAAFVAVAVEGKGPALQGAIGTLVPSELGPALVAAVPSDGRVAALVPVLTAAAAAAQDLGSLPASAGPFQRLTASGRAWALVGLWRVHLLVSCDRVLNSYSGTDHPRGAPAIHLASKVVAHSVNPPVF